MCLGRTVPFPVESWIGRYVKCWGLDVARESTQAGAFQYVKNGHISLEVRAAGSHTA